MSLVIPIHEVKAKTINLAYAKAIEVYGSEATVLNTRQEEDGDCVITLCSRDTKGIDKAALKLASEQPTSVVVESSEDIEIEESVAQIMEMISNKTSLNHMETSANEAETIVEELMDMGFDYRFATDVVQKVLKSKPAADTSDVLRVIGEKIPYVEEDVISQGGWVSVMGPTGVGKTTTLSKLASLYSRMFSPEEIALVTVDTYRIGAVNQLQEFAELIGVDFHVCHSPSELKAKTEELKHKSLVLLDTAGKSQKDKLLHSQLKGYLDGNIKNLLVLNAGTQLDGINNIIEEFMEFGISGLVLTKLDEVMKMGAAITAVCKNGVPVQYLTTGQKVPSDIEKADQTILMRRACDLAGRKWVK
ncbi:flagellar biosynthesis protein FlhF [Alteromonas macleodii]|uniref:flagellar biosynthesis protein FlhF n=1 Tax=Alteromonas macleodii TaxID=28108 RepID=UPI0031408368|tara:strand:+ start:143369 stop:144451 length:1083 start_codon:yes stop_codon:yes gene_type:complete